MTSSYFIYLLNCLADDAHLFFIALSIFTLVLQFKQFSSSTSSCLKPSRRWRHCCLWKSSGSNFHSIFAACFIKTLSIVVGSKWYDSWICCDLYMWTYPTDPLWAFCKGLSRIMFGETTINPSNGIWSQEKWSGKFYIFPPFLVQINKAIDDDEDMHGNVQAKRSH